MPRARKRAEDGGTRPADTAGLEPAADLAEGRVLAVGTGGGSEEEARPDGEDAPEETVEAGEAPDDVDLEADLLAGDGAAQGAPAHPDKKWYVVHTYSGYEGKVKANLEKRVESMLMQDKIFRIIVPTEDEIEYKDGRKLITKKKIFPGYVMVEMIMNDDSWYVVRNTPGVTGFVGSGMKPVPLDPAEVRTILRHMGVDDPKPKVVYEDGESVKVISGPFMGFIGKVREVNLDKGKLRVFVSMFGRETPVELDFAQVEKL